MVNTSEKYAPEVNKIAEITIYFWVLKVLATTLGETAGDYLSMSLKLGYLESLGITVVALVILIAIQIRFDRFLPLVFWAAIVATTTTGTEVSDFMDRTLGLGYVGGSIILSAALLATLAVWFYREGNVDIDPIVKKDAEILFWIAVIFSNSLGTAFGDFLTDVVGFSFVTGSLVTAGIIGIVAALHYMKTVNDIALFWIAFVFTRPFGATFGDFLTKSTSHGALDLSRAYASLTTLTLMGIFLILSARSETRTERSNVRRGR